MRPARLIVPLVACGLAFAAAAQAPMYRSTMPDGKVIISDQPARGASKVEELKPRAGNTAPGDPLKPGEGIGKSDRSAALSAAESELKSAQGAYDAALKRAEQGREEREGDRIGTYKGGARLSEAYEKRQASLKAEVDAARARLDEARRKFNQAR